MMVELRIGVSGGPKLGAARLVRVVPFIGLLESQSLKWIF